MQMMGLFSSVRTSTADFEWLDLKYARAQGRSVFRASFKAVDRTLSTLNYRLESDFSPASSFPDPAEHRIYP
jgi:hypothetical protein